MSNFFLHSYIKKLCTGCSACSNVCAHHAITMKEDEEGFLFPEIDPEKCVYCGVCDKTCPVSGNNQANHFTGQQSYLITTNEKFYFLESATIGLCTMLAYHVVEQGGYVFGVFLEEKEYKAKHIRVNTKEGIESIRNSKYVQSDTNNSFSEVKRLLQKDRNVLYIGTPCQIAGLKAFLRKDYDNLLTLDLICHGTYSYKLLQKEIEYWEKRLQGTISNFKFRSKKIYPWIKGGIVNFDLKKKNIKRHYEFLGKYSPTYRCYAYSEDDKNYNLREVCYSCPFREKGRYGDLTVGDSWFIEQNKYYPFKSEDYSKGISLVICNTKKGEAALNKISSLLDKVIEITNEEAFVQPALLPTNREIPAIRYQLYENIDNEDYGKLVNRLLNVNLEKIYKKEMTLSFRIRMKEFLKKVLLINKIHILKSEYKDGLEWWFINSFLYNFPSKRFRNYCLRKMGMSIDKDVRIYAGFHIRDPKGIIIEKGVSIGPKVLLDGRRGLTIKESAVIGYGAIIWTLNHDYNDIHFKVKGAPITIGKFAWVCSNSIILPGVTIGEGAVVASGAIVTHDVPPYTIVGGIPAKVIGQRDKKEYDYGYSVKSDIFHFC